MLQLPLSSAEHENDNLRPMAMLDISELGTRSPHCQILYYLWCYLGALGMSILYNWWYVALSGERHAFRLEVRRTKKKKEKKKAHNLSLCVFSFLFFIKSVRTPTIKVNHLLLSWSLLRILPCNNSHTEVDKVLLKAPKEHFINPYR
jgi:hypothetical protein